MKVLVVIPTYNEIENIDKIVERTRASLSEADVLVVDDSSPDGTGERVRQLAAADRQIHLLERPGKSGLGAAYRAGFQWGLDRSYEVLVEMDADGSHPPERLPALVAGLSDADLVIGSRWVPGGSVVNWPASRKLLSLGGNMYARLMLGLDVRDATAGFRAFPAATIEKLGLLRSDSQGYVFQVDSTFRASQAGLRLAEVPIEFTERTVGASKMSRKIVFEAMMQVTRWALVHRLLRRPVSGLATGA